MRFRCHLFSILATLVLTHHVAAQWQHPPGATLRAFGKGNPFRAEELPAGKLKSRLLALNPPEKEKAMKWLHRFNFNGTDAADHLRVDPRGGIFMVCPDSHGSCEGHSHPPAPADADAGRPAAGESAAPAAAQTSEAPLVALAAVSVSSPPAYHSRPGASKCIYLDFNGGLVSGTDWNATPQEVLNVKVWSQDADRTTFNDAEQAWMKNVWQRVAEDFAPFEVNVTTDTAYDPDNYTGNKNNVGWLLICETTDNNGVALPHNGSGGVAYVDVFGTSYYASSYQPAWVSSTNGGGSESIVAEAAAHEIGHNMGLSHDGTSAASYYGGHGSGDVSWGPLMGTGYNRNVSQWSKGEYYNANLFEDDLSIISTKVPYRSDDHGDTALSATPLAIPDGTTISSTSPEGDPSNSNPANKGVIEQNTDVDVFSFYTGAGNIQLNAKPWVQPSGTRGGNLDILLELYDGAGTLIASNNSANLTSAAISTTLAEGYHYLHVRNSGTGSPLASAPTGYTSYGSIGQYFISGTIITPPLTLTGITHPSGVSNSTVKVSITGTGMLAATSVRLTRSGNADISATQAQVIGSTLTCRFDLSGAAAGAWNVVATNPNLETATLPAAFTIIDAIWSQNFDGTITGWTSDASTGTNTWDPITSQSQSPDTSYFADGPSSKTTTNLNSPNVAIPSAATGLQLRFWHTYDLQSTRDAGRLEFSINNGSWFDVEASSSGAAFLSNGYNSTVNSSGTSSTRNEFAGQRAWSGNSNGFVETVINLTDTAKYAGNNLRMRWRIATNSTTSSIGWHVDSIVLLGTLPIPDQAPQITAAASTSSTEFETDPDSSVHQIIRGTQALLTVGATDDGGEAALTYTWSVTSGPASPVVFLGNANNAAKNTTAVFQAAGDYQISVAIADIGGHIVTSSVHVRIYQTVDSLAVSPFTAGVAFGASQQFSAVLLDQFGALMNSQPSSFTWFASGGGTIDPGGLFHATAAGGPFVVTAQSGGVSNNAGVTVTPASASIVLSDLTPSYDGSPKPATITTDPAGLPVSVNYDGSPTAPTDAGVYQVEVIIDDPNYEGSASATLVIQKAPQNIAFAPLTAATFGNATFSLNATASSALLVSYVSSNPLVATLSGNIVTIVGAGDSTITASQAGDSNHQPAPNISQLLTVNKATAVVTLSDLTQTYDGEAKPVAVSSDPIGLSVTTTYDGSSPAPTAAGSYTVVSTINDPNYEGSASATLVIQKAPQNIAFAPLTAETFGNATFSLNATASSSLPVSYVSSNPLVATLSGNIVMIVGAGSANLTASQAGDSNHQPAPNVSQLLTVNKASAVVTLSDLTQTYDGNPKPATVSTQPAALTVATTYDGSSTTPIAAGSYAVVATIDDPNYQGSATGTLLIEPGKDLVSWKNQHFTPTEQGAGLSANLADPDNDGFQNLAEFALGTAPREFTPPLVPTLDANGLSLIFTRPANLPGVSYFAESTQEFGTWEPLSIEVITPGDPETVQVRDSLNTGDPAKRFLRLRFEPE